MKIGNISFNPEAFKDYTKEQFFAEYTGKLVIDKEKVWDIICNYNNPPKSRLVGNYETPRDIVKDESINNISEQGKKSKRRGFDEGTQSGS